MRRPAPTTIADATATTTCGAWVALTFGLHHALLVITVAALAYSYARSRA